MNAQTDAQTPLYPLTAAQTGIWYSQMLAPQNPFYNLAEYCDIAGPIDPPVFEQALRHMVSETECLHIRLVETDEGPMQVIGPSHSWELALVDVSSSTELLAAAVAWMHEDAQLVFDLGQGPLFRYALLRLAPDRYLWYYCIHQVCIDGFGGALVTHRVAALYSALMANERLSQVASGGYAELLESEWDYRHSSRHTRDGEYWKEQAADWPERVTLSGYVPSPTEVNQSVYLELSPSQLSELSTQSPLAGASVPQVLTAVVALYHHRLSGARDVILGFALTGRIGARMRHSAGMVSTVVPLRLRLESSMRWGDVVKQVSRRIRQALRHQGYNGETLRRELGLGPGDPDLYGTVVNLSSFDYGLRFGDHRADVHFVGNRRVKDLELLIRERRDGSEIRVEFYGHGALYSQASLAAHKDRFELLLRHVCHWDLDRPLYKFDLVSSSERQQVLEGFNGPSVPMPLTTLVALFESQVLQTPASAAVILGDQVVSYGELNDQANRLAHHLIGLGVGPECLVGVCLERSIELVVALLGILKSGGRMCRWTPHIPRRGWPIGLQMPRPKWSSPPKDWSRDCHQR